MEQTPAGCVFLDHARVTLLQVEAASEAARRAARPAKTAFVVGFLTGYEMDWLPKVLEARSDALQCTELVIRSASSPELAQGLLNLFRDIFPAARCVLLICFLSTTNTPQLAAGIFYWKNRHCVFLRPNNEAHGLEFKIVTNEVLFALLPADHRLASRRSIRLDEIVGEPFINFPKSYAPALRRVIDDYLARSGAHLATAHEAETLPMVISLVLSTGELSFVPAYMQNQLPPSVVSRKLHGRA
jgi:LysR family hca operon transcriptional activator